MDEVEYMTMKIGSCPSIFIDADSQCPSWIWALQRRMESLREEDEEAERERHWVKLWEQWDKSNPFPRRSIAVRPAAKSFIELARGDVKERLEKESRVVKEKHAKAKPLIERIKQRRMRGRGESSDSAISDSPETQLPRDGHLDGIVAPSNAKGLQAASAASLRAKRTASVASLRAERTASVASLRAKRTSIASLRAKRTASVASLRAKRTVSVASLRAERTASVASLRAKRAVH